jgi:hypothetical protein
VARLTGGCHCRNITVSVELTRAASSYRPRACDCELCRRHGAGIAEMLLCRNCGVLVAALWQGPPVHGVVNANVLEARESFAAVQPVSPKSLSADAKVSRWQQLWFADVRLVAAEAG